LAERLQRPDVDQDAAVCVYDHNDEISSEFSFELCSTLTETGETVPAKMVQLG
jgi:hypothetical protein